MRAFVCLALLLPLVSGAACRRKPETGPPVATASFSINHPRAPLGSPVEITYRFVVASDAPPFAGNYKALVHFMDADDELMWTDDHDPQPPTSQWKPGQTIEYRRTMFVPIYPYIGQATVQMGLYSHKDGSRLVLAGTDTGQRAYNAGTIELLPQSDNVFLIYKDGWNQAEVAPDNAAVEWQWTKREATLSFRNTRRDVTLYLHLDGRPDLFPSPQQMGVRLGSQTVDTFAIDTRAEIIRKIPLAAAQLGTADMVDIVLSLDKAFVPALTPAAKSNDPRELGVRVFHAFVEPR